MNPKPLATNKPNDVGMTEEEERELAEMLED
jgi:hypothetical protein